jgi:hemoglobin/transferrin/lactoferrin receptor protein
MLGQSGGVFIQKSQLGGGSPMIRGFAANRVLMVMDGVRMNNAIYRAGNLQNVIAVDANMLEHSEVLYGPGSVMYGSDALGGVMVFESASAKPLLTEGGAFVRYSTANNEKTGHVDFNRGLSHWAFRTGVTYSEFGDLRAGANHPDNYKDFGTRPWYVERVGNRDSSFVNDNVNVQEGSAYDQFNLMQKIDYLPAADWDASYTLQYSTTSDVPRYDRITQAKSDGTTPKYGDWYYGPQDWLSNNLRLHKDSGNSLWDEADIAVSHQYNEESRHDRKFGDPKINHRTEGVNVFALNIDLARALSVNRKLTYGAEVTHNIVTSEGEGENLDSGEKFPISTRYPDGGSRMTSISGYVQEQHKFTPDWTVTAGLRYCHHMLHSEFDDKSYFAFPFDNIDINTGAVTGQLGTVYLPKPDLRFRANFASGFRAPNVDDAAKVFDSQPGSVIVPNDKLAPEYSYNVEGGIEKSFMDRVTLSANGYYSWLVDEMVRRNHTFNGQDSIMYDGEMSQVQAIVNAGRGYLTGFDVGIGAQIDSHWSARTILTYTAGRDREADVAQRHVPPLYGQSSVKYEARKWSSELFAVYNNWKSWSDLSPDEQGKPDLYTVDGTPTWLTLNLRGAYSVTHSTEVTAALENIFDLHYRPFSSGISAPGRNFVVALRQSF